MMKRLSGIEFQQDGALWAIIWNANLLCKQIFLTLRATRDEGGLGKASVVPKALSGLAWSRALVRIFGEIPGYTCFSKARSGGRK